MTVRIRLSLALALGAVALGFGAAPAAAQGAPGAQPVELGKYNAWGAYSAAVKNGKVCYALAQPGSRRPAGLNRDPAYFFVSNRPTDSVKNEVSIVVGFSTKPESAVQLGVGGQSFSLYTRADGAFMQSAEEEAKLIQAMKGGSDMTVKATSLRGNVTTDTYSLAGVTAALDRIDRECR